jgi:hypothetical protein
VPRAKTRDTRTVAEQRIAEYVIAHWPNVRAAGEALGVDHGTLWRTMKGNNEKGPSIVVVTALADHSGKSTDYFLGRGE